jgi:hypothetical protein
MNEEEKENRECGVRECLGCERSGQNIPALARSSAAPEGAPNKLMMRMRGCTLAPRPAAPQLSPLPPPPAARHTAREGDASL